MVEDYGPGEAGIHSLGRQGDGVANWNGKTLHLPYTLPGEVVRVAGEDKRAAAAEVVKPSPDRIAPICPHFGTCGGCQLQHMADAAYRSWKVSLLMQAFDRAKIEVSLEPVRTYPVASRRKAVLVARRIDGKLAVGFSARRSRDIVPMETCPVLVPEIAGKLEAFNSLARLFEPERDGMRISILAAQNGLDISISGVRHLRAETRKATIGFAGKAGFVRLAVDGEVLVEFEPPQLMADTVPVVPPPGAFVQAVEAAESDMAALVTEHLANCKRVADLYCGFGTFALRLAHNSTVMACEADAPAIAALDRAWRKTAGELKQVTTEVRDLERRPVFAQELEKIDGLVFDPPRAGAEAQAKQIARSKVGKVAAVSCNPETLVRDLAILLKGGYRIVEVTPVDQFRFTPHIEVVALLER